MQLFEKLKLQESSEDDEAAKKHKTSKSTQSSGVSPSSTEPTSSGPVKTKQDQHVSLKAQGPEASQKKGSQTYGRVRTRHVNQLFIRGENVILVNPEPLWFLFAV